MFYGKTGTGASRDGQIKIGWFVGCIESADGKTFAFATNLQGNEASGAAARTLKETILQKLEFL